MSDKTTVKKNCYIPVYETEALANYFSDMAQQGLFIFELYNKSSGYNKSIKFVFRKYTPRHLYYCVDLFEPKDIQSFSEYLEICEASGWKYVCSMEGGIFVFYSETPQIPLQTDCDTEAECLKKVSRRNLIDLVWPVLLLLIFAFNPLFDYFTNPLSFYGSDMRSPTYPLFCIFCLPFVFRKIGFYVGCQKKIKLLHKNIRPMDNPYQKSIRTSLLFKWYSVCLVCLFTVSSVFSLSGLFVQRSGHEIPAYASKITAQTSLDIGQTNNDFYHNPASVFIKRQYELYQHWGANEESCFFEVEYADCAFDFIAKDIYNHENATFSDGKGTDFSTEECKYLKITQGKYIIRTDSASVIILLRDKKGFYELRISGLSLFSENKDRIFAAISDRAD